LDNESKEAQKAGVKIILETVSHLISEDHKYRKRPIESIYVMGDFNIDDKDTIFDTLYNSKYKFISTRQVADTEDASTCTFHAPKGSRSNTTTIIDHVLFSSTKITVSKFRVIKGEQPYISNHYPVVADFVKA